MATAHGWMQAIMWVNPLTYSIALLNYTLRLPNAAPGPVESLAVTAAFGLVLLLVSRLHGRPEGARAARHEAGTVAAILRCWRSCWPRCVQAQAACQSSASVPEFPLIAPDRPALRQQVARRPRLGGGLHLHHLRRSVSR